MIGEWLIACDEVDGFSGRRVRGTSLATGLKVILGWMLRGNARAYEGGGRKLLREAEMVSHERDEAGYAGLDTQVWMCRRMNGLIRG